MKNYFKKNQKTIWVFILIIGLYFYGTNNIPLLNRTDSRYAEIAREMITTGNYLVPQLFGTPHLHKPPLSYWFIAFGMKIFGINEFGARFFLVVFSVLSLLLIYLIAKKIFDKEKALWALILSALSPGIFFTTRVLETDIFLLFFESAAFYFYLNFQKDKREKWIYLFWTALGLGFLTKGPVAPVIPLLIIITASALKSDFSEIKPLFRIKFLLMFFVIAFPWFLYLILSNKRILSYFLIDQIYARIAGIKGVKIGHPKPFYFYFAILPILILPFYLPFLIAIIKKIKEGLNQRDIFVITWFSIPLLFFSLILTKLPTYILFSIPPMAMITAEWIEETNSKSKTLWLSFGLLPFLILLNNRIFKLSPQIDERLIKISLTAGIIFLILLFSFNFIKKTCARPMFLISWAIIYLMVINLFISFPEVLNSNKKVAKLTKGFTRKNFKIISFKQYAFQLPFYTNATPYFCQVKFEKGIFPFKKTIKCEELKQNWGKSDFLVLTFKKDLKELSEIVGDCFILAYNGKIYVVSNKPLWGTKIRWKQNVKTHKYGKLNNLFKFIKTPIKIAREKARKSVDNGFTLHDEELAVLNNRLYFEFEFIKGEKLKEIHIDPFNGKVTTDYSPKEMPEFSDSELKKLTNISKEQAKNIALNLIDGKIKEREREIENGELCYSFHIIKEKWEYEVLVNSFNGLPFKISTEQRISQP